MRGVNQGKRLLLFLGPEMMVSTQNIYCKTENICNAIILLSSSSDRAVIVVGNR